MKLLLQQLKCGWLENCADIAILGHYVISTDAQSFNSMHGAGRRSANSKVYLVMAGGLNKLKRKASAASDKLKTAGKKLHKKIKTVIKAATSKTSSVAASIRSRSSSVIDLGGDSDDNGSDKSSSKDVETVEEELGQ